MRTRSAIALTFVLALTSVACSGAGADLSTTSSLLGGTTQPEPSTTTTTSPPSPSTTLRGQTITEYEVVQASTDDNGDVLYILVPPGAYTDIDLENFIWDLRDGNPSLWRVEIFDDDGVLAALLVPEDQRTEDQQKLLDEHHFVSLVDGDILRFQGPFSEFGEYALSS